MLSNFSTLLSDSAFFRVLTAPYVPPLPPRSVESSSIDADEAKCCASIVDWSRTLITPDSSDDDEAANTSISSPFFDNLSHAIYKPHGKWAWTDGLPIENSNVLAYISCELVLSSFIFFVASRLTSKIISSRSNVLCNNQVWQLGRLPRHIHQ
jgi:hypothetical protein